MFTTLAFFLMAVVLMLAVIGDALWGHFRGAGVFSGANLLRRRGGGGVGWGRWKRSDQFRFRRR